MRFLLALPLLLAACSPTIANRGHMVDADKLAQVKTGVSTREDVALLLGTPSHRPSFDDKTWYYIGRTTTQYSFFIPDVLEQTITVVKFDSDGVVTTLEQIDKTAAADIDAAPGQTPTYGRQTTWIQDLFGNIGRPGLPSGGQRGGN